jgi:hypothetical protein
VVAFVPPATDRAGVADLAAKRFGTLDVVVGDSAELVDHFGALESRGVERVYAWFTDFAHPDTLAAFGESVLGALR